MKSTRRGSFSVHRSEKTPGSKYSSTSGLSPRGHLERQAEFHPGRTAARGARRPRAARRQPGGAARARRPAGDDGLPRRGARQPPPEPAGDGRAAAADGGHRTRRPVQPRPPDLAPGDAEGTRHAVLARPLKAGPSPGAPRPPPTARRPPPAARRQPPADGP